MRPRRPDARIRHILAFLFIFPATFEVAQAFSKWAGLWPWSLIIPVGAVVTLFLLLGITSGDPDDDV